MTYVVMYIVQIIEEEVHGQSQCLHTDVYVSHRKQVESLLPFILLFRGIKALETNALMNLTHQKTNS